jgi:pimeloyl-ACP methyl ester carboxylesterase
MPLILLTPVGLDRRAWELGDLLEHPAAVPHEFPGFGARARAPITPTMTSLADEVAGSYDGQLDLVGVSMGGMVAQHVCIRFPERVRSAVVACTGPDADPATMTARARAALGAGMEGVLDETMARWFTQGALASRPALPGVRYARDTLRRLDPRSFADGWSAIATHDARSGLPSVRARVTVIAGLQDESAPVDRCAEIATLIPRARLVTMPGPHMLALEQAAAFSAAVRLHLGEVERRAQLGAGSPAAPGAPGGS